MANANKANITKRLDLSRPLAVSEADQNLEELINSIEDVEILQSNRTIFKGSVSEIQNLSIPAGRHVYLTEAGREGSFVIKSGSQPKPDPDFGMYIPISNGNYAERVSPSIPNIGHFGANFSGDESQTAINMLSVLGYLLVPRGKTLTCKNVEVNSNQAVLVYGEVKLPDNSSDFDRIFYGDSKTNVVLDINTINGNSSGQSGNVGTHLIYFTNSLVDCKVKLAKDHYYPVGYWSGNSPDGYRNSGSGALFFHSCHDSTIHVDRLENWGHEGLYVPYSNRTTVSLGHGQGSENGDEYSAVQVSGDYCKLLFASCDLAGASGIGFDVRWGSAGRLVSTNSRTNHGVNFGHPGIPSDGSVVESIVVNGANGNGVNFGAGTQGMVVSSVSVTNVCGNGINQSDNATYNVISGGSVQYSGSSNIRNFAGFMNITGVNARFKDPIVLTLSSVSGSGFSEGETITGSSSGASATVRYYWNSSSAAGVTKVFLSNLTGSFTTADTITGGSSGTTGSVSAVTIPDNNSNVGGGSQSLQNVVLSVSPQIGFLNVSGQTSVVVQNGNIYSGRLPTISAANSQGAESQPYIASVGDGTFTIEFGSGAALTGAQLRYSIN